MSSPITKHKVTLTDEQYSDLHRILRQTSVGLTTQRWTAILQLSNDAHKTDEVIVAEVVTFVCDHLNTHHLSRLYKAFDAGTAGRVRLVHTPANGSWLIVAEMELSVLSRQCLGKRRFQTKGEMAGEWATRRNATQASTRWQFSTADARVKLHALHTLPHTRHGSIDRLLRSPPAFSVDSTFRVWVNGGTSPSLPTSRESEARP